MAHFAEINSDNIVQRIIVVNNEVLLDSEGVEQEALGSAFCEELLGGIWVQTSYNGNFRGKYAAPGDVYDSIKDAFIPNKPFESWILNETTFHWEAPIPMPNDGKTYTWNESTNSWVEVIKG